MSFKLEDIVIDNIHECKIYDLATNQIKMQWSESSELGIIHGYSVMPWDITWHNYASYDGDVKLGQVLYNIGLMQGIVTKIIYDREKKWWQFWIRRKQTGCYVEWSESNV